MRSLYIFFALFLAGACQSRQETRNTKPFPTQASLKDQTTDKYAISGPIALNHPEAGLPFGEMEERTIGRMMLANPSTYRTPQRENILFAGATSPLLEKDVAEALEKAADMMPPEYGIYLIAAYRSMEEQHELIRQNCENPPGYKSCQPKPTYPETCMPASGQPNTCPHTTGRVVDAWGMEKANGEWQQCTSQNFCLMSEHGLEASASACTGVRCQAALISAMKKNGFCVSRSQPWHFENPKLTRDCFF